MKAWDEIFSDLKELNDKIHKTNEKLKETMK
jgi:hypothetical protein